MERKKADGFDFGNAIIKVHKLLYFISFFY